MNDYDSKYENMKNILEKTRNFLYVSAYMSILSIVLLLIIIVKQGNQIKTQSEYIEAQEWQEYVEEDARIEAEHMNMLEEMRKGNE